MGIGTSQRAGRTAPAAGTPARRPPRRRAVAVTLVGAGLLGAAVAASWPTAPPELEAGFGWGLEVAGAPWATVSGPIGDTVTVIEATDELRIERLFTVANEGTEVAPLADIDGLLARRAGALTFEGCALIPLEANVAIRATTGEIADRADAVPFTGAVEVPAGSMAFAWLTSAYRSDGAPCVPEAGSVSTYTATVASTSAAEFEGAAGTWIEHDPVTVITEDLDAYLDRQLVVTRHPAD